MKIVLASKSPRRSELLRRAGIEEFDIDPARNEEQVPEGLSPDETVRRIALGKAEEVAARRGAGETVVGADTLVWLDDAPLGKPKDELDAKRMLRALSGRAHEVYTGVAVISGDKKLSAAEKTRVFFREMTDGEIDAYVKSGEPLDKAGAYGIQGLGGVFIEGIEGDYNNVVGLPICLTCKLLGEAGYTLGWIK